MSRNKNKSDILSGLGTAFDIFKALKDAGIDDEAMRRLISDKQLAQDVANVVTAPTDSDFMYRMIVSNDLVDVVSPAFSHEMQAGWLHGTQCVRTYLFQANASYGEDDLERFGPHATVHSLWQYAKGGWNRKDTVFAFGSSREIFGVKHYPCLWVDEHGMRHLDVVPASSRRTAKHFMLLPRY